MKRFLYVALGTMILLCGCGRNLASETVSRQYVDVAMGTVVRQVVYCSEEAAAEAFSGRAMELLEELEGELLSWRLESSQVYSVNASGGNEEGVRLSEELAEILRQCLQLYRDSEGAFDVTMGPAVRLWNIDQWAAGQQEGEFELPDPQELKQTLEICGSGRLKLGEGEAPVLYLPEGMQLDLGAVGKGLALTELLGLLERESRITGAVISVGGSVLTYGSKPDGSSWRVGIPDPADTSSNVGILSLEGQWCVSTSGDYERYAEVDGVRYHHILDPATGYPADSGVRSVTVLTREGLIGDGLSTACFILGPRKGMELAGKYGAEVLFVLEDGKIVMSEGMEKTYFQRQ